MPATLTVRTLPCEESREKLGDGVDGGLSLSGDFAAAGANSCSAIIHPTSASVETIATTFCFFSHFSTLSWAAQIVRNSARIQLMAVEVFKFATYLFIPIFAMLHFGDPDWYEHHVAPVRRCPVLH